MMKTRFNQTGISYVEVLVTTLLIAILLTPALESMKPGIQSAEIHQEDTRMHYLLSGKLEFVLSRPFDELQLEAAAVNRSTPSSYSELNNNEFDHYVYISEYDIDNMDGDNDVYTGTEQDMLWIEVTNLDGSITFETLITEP